MRDVGIDTLKGKTLLSVTVSNENDRIVFQTNSGEQYRMMHQQDCCENVRVEEIIGSLDDLVGSPILEAEEQSGSNDGTRTDCSESYTWTFYKLGTIRGHVTIRWLGESNGYYGEDVWFEQVT